VGLYFYNARWYDPLLGRFTQPDSIVPQAGSPLAWDRYSYVNNNPINYSDPSGHWPYWFDSIGQFAQGLLFEFTRTSNWVGAIVSPSVAEVLAPSSGETDAMLGGRIVGDVLTIAVGVGEVNMGMGIAGVGIAVGCGTTACLASAPALAAGAAVASVGVVTASSGSIALGNNLGIAFSSRRTNDLKPDPNATGSHSTFKRDPVSGKITNYETYRPQTNPQNPNQWERILRYDGIGKMHYETGTSNYLLPHVHDFLNNFIRKPFWYEIPK
jgi:hypothetical protein